MRFPFIPAKAMDVLFYIHVVSDCLFKCKMTQSPNLRHIKSTLTHFTPYATIATSKPNTYSFDYITQDFVWLKKIVTYILATDVVELVNYLYLRSHPCYSSAFLVAVDFFEVVFLYKRSFPRYILTYGIR